MSKSQDIVGWTDCEMLPIKIGKGILLTIIIVYCYTWWTSCGNLLHGVGNWRFASMDSELPWRRCLLSTSIESQLSTSHPLETMFTGNELPIPHPGHNEADNRGPTWPCRAITEGHSVSVNHQGDIIYFGRVYLYLATSEVMDGVRLCCIAHWWQL